ncbi:hypothetical protein MMC30_002772 [Trapelia coarctata]|nr:hypothetical protein [Trapelia coarctata]
MHVLAIVHALMAWALVQVIAAPHLLMLLDSRATSIHDLKNRNSPLDMILGSKQLLRRDATPVAQVFATVTSNFGATSSVSIEQTESSEGVPFRRDLNSVVAQNIPTLMETKTGSGIPGFEAFAEAVRQGLANGKRDLAKLFTRGLFARDSKAGDSAKCGGRLSCFGQGQGGITTRGSPKIVSTRDSQSADCGGRVSCFKERIVGAANISTRDSQTADCGGRLSCFKKRIVDAVKIFTRDTQESTTSCILFGKKMSCLKKRTAAAEPEAMYNPPALTPREPVAEPQTFHTCDGGLCYGGEENVEKRATNDLALEPRDATANPQVNAGGLGTHSCGLYECMDN